jgi:3-oxoacyl-[acyl-carrier protein] reductase
MINLDLTGKNALVCGSSQGIGKAIAIELADLGANVTLLARNQQALEAVCAELKQSDNQHHHILTADFSDNNQVQQVIGDHVNAGNHYHILVNNTGGPAPGPAHKSAPEDYLAGFHQHLINNQILVSALIPGMEQAGYGRIINVISTSVKQPIPNLGVSNTVRGAVASWAKTLASELGPKGITVNSVLPGATNTVRLSAIFENKAKKLGKTVEQVAEEERNSIPMRRFGEPNELAGLVAFLSSPAGGYISGTSIAVDGGRTQCL